MHSRRYEWGFDALPSSHSEPLPYTPASQFVLPQLRHTYEPHHFSRPPTIDASGPNAQGTRLHSVGMPASHALMRHQGPFPTFGSTPCVVSSVLPSATYPTSWTDSEYRGVYVTPYTAAHLHKTLGVSGRRAGRQQGSSVQAQRDLQMQNGHLASSNASVGEREAFPFQRRILHEVQQSKAPVGPEPAVLGGNGRQIKESVPPYQTSAHDAGTRNDAGTSGFTGQSKGKTKDVSHLCPPQMQLQSFNTVKVYPYMFPAYGLVGLTDSLVVGVKIPDWTQVVRAAIILTARVEDLRHIQSGRCPPQDFVPLVDIKDCETWVSEWFKKQPIQRRLPVIPSQVMSPQDCLQYPQDTSASDWSAFWPSTRRTVFTVLSGLKACSPYRTVQQADGAAMDPTRWSLWVRDVLWTLRQLIRTTASESSTIMTFVKRAEEFQSLEAPIAQTPYPPHPPEEATNQSIADPSSGELPTNTQQSFNITPYPQPSSIGAPFLRISASKLSPPSLPVSEVPVVFPPPQGWKRAFEHVEEIRQSPRKKLRLTKSPIVTEENIRSTLRSESDNSARPSVPGRIHFSRHEGASQEEPMGVYPLDLDAIPPYGNGSFRGNIG